MSGTVENITVIGQRRSHDPNELRIVVNGTSYTGWTDTKVRRGVEIMPSSFDIMATDKLPIGALAMSKFPINAGDVCKVFMGDDLVITGYVDSITSSITSTEHTVRVSGRGKCQDLVDCSAGVTPPDKSVGGQYAATTILGFFQAIASPFGVTAKVLQAEIANSTQVPQLTINFGESPFEIIDRVARWCGCLAYEDQHGQLIIARGSTTSAASGIGEGTNVQAMTATRSIAERYSIYLGSLMSIDDLSQARPPTQNYAFDGKYPDNGVPRFRPRIIVSEQVTNGLDVCNLRAQWEGNRRFGRGQTVNVTIDTWRDSAKTLWTPNTLVTVDLPSVAAVPKDKWLIGEVTYSRGMDGTTAMLTLMPQQAYSPEPEALGAVDFQVADGVKAGGAAK